MKPRDFFDLVAEMRKAQQNYFKTRDFAALTRARRLENQIDKEIDRVKRIINEPEIF